MLFFLITCSFSFIFIYKSFSSEMTILSLWFWKDFSFQTHSITKCITNTFFGITHSFLSSRPMIKNLNSCPKVEMMMSSEMCVLDLPDLALESILEKLEPEGLCVMASVCTYLKDKCISDHFWEQHMKNKWGGVVGSAAIRNWQCYIASSKNSIFFNQGKRKGVFSNYFADLWPLALIRSTFSNINGKNNFPPIDSVMSWYLALESGKFWFPAQVYNRENGHVGFMLSCYDAELCYDKKTNTFQARYPPHGRRASTIETGITWDRVRAPLVDESPHDLHVSDCLSELYPGDHIEIQWRRNNDFPYGWWYGVVGHLETCDGNSNYCQCHDSDTLVLEFKQYTLGSRWRRTSISRKDHTEKGNETDGFYGGIHKLCKKEEISTWKKLWPADILE